jgi:hypothetical protein
MLDTSEQEEVNMKVSLVKRPKNPTSSAMPNCKIWPHNPPHCGCPAG